MRSRQIITDFYDRCPLSEVQQTLSDLLLVALTSENKVYQTPSERYKIAEFSVHLQSVLEAIHTVIPKRVRRHVEKSDKI